MADKNAKGPIICVAHKPLPPSQTWQEALDEAVHRRFGVVAKTYQTRSGYATSIVKADGTKIAPALNNRISHFIAGFMACERGY